MSCHLSCVSKICLKLDYLGIVLKTFSTQMPAIYFSLHDHPERKKMYMSQVAVCGCITFRVMLDPNMDGSTNSIFHPYQYSQLLKSLTIRSTKYGTIAFLSLGAGSFTPKNHSTFVDHVLLKNFPLFQIIASTVLFVLGMAVHVLQIAKRYWTYVFDVRVSKPNL